MKKILFFLVLGFVSYASFAAEPAQEFAEIFKALDGVKFAGKSIDFGIENLEKVSPRAHIAATDGRIIVVWDDDIIGNWPRPKVKDWEKFGEISAEIAEKITARAPLIVAGEFYNALMSGIGKYIPAENIEDGKILTSAGLEGRIDSRGNFRIAAVVRGGAADLAGLRAGDLISAVNGSPVSIADFSGLNSGTIRLSVATPEGEKKITLRRATIITADADIIVRNAKHEARDAKILEIVAHKISENAVSIINEAIAVHRDADGIVLDLRVAGGGDETAAAKLAGLFIGQSPVMRIAETAGEEIEIVPGGAAATDARLVVLVSGATSGVAEVIALALHEKGRGILIGTPTAGSAKLATKIALTNGASLELLNRVAKSGQGAAIDDRGVFPIVCLSSIRNSEQQNAFFVNILNGDFDPRDYNKDDSVSADKIRAGCPQIKSGADEDAVSAAVSIKILTDDKIYGQLANVSDKN